MNSFSFEKEGDHIALVLRGVDGALRRGRPVAYPMTRAAARQARDRLNELLGEGSPAVVVGVDPGQGDAHAVAVVEVAPGEPPRLMAASVRAAGYTGSECRDCGSMRMVRNGTCEKCEDCGGTTGCS